MNGTMIKIGAVMTYRSYGSNYPEGISDWGFLDGPPELIDERDTQCGHNVEAAILDEMGYKDHFNAKCHHCKHFDGDITDDQFEKLCEMEGKHEYRVSRL